MQSRRHFIASSVLTATAAAVGCHTAQNRPAKEDPQKFLFVTNGKTAIMNSDGTGFRIFEFNVPNQATWQPSAFFPDGRRILFLSMEPRRDGPGKPFEEFYTQTPTHLWIHDLRDGSLKEIATRDRLAVFYTPELLIGEDRILVQVTRNKVGQIFSMNLDGSDAREFTRAGEGLPYGLDLSPDKKRVVFHLASPKGYQIWSSDVNGSDRRELSSDPDRLFFGPRWSPDGEWIAYQGCDYKSDPGHDWSDAWICRPDGSAKKRLTDGQSLWFAATYGGLKRKGGGSNMLSWTREGLLLLSRRSPGARVPWEYQAGRRDVDHFNREFKPEQARGGTQICTIDPRSSKVIELTHTPEGVWNCRPGPSRLDSRILFCRAETGELPGIWMMNGDGSDQKLLTRGVENSGADHPRWVA